MYILGGDSEDLIQEGMIGLFKAVRITTVAETPAFTRLRSVHQQTDVYGGAGIAAAEAHTVEYLCLPWTAMEERKRTGIRRHRRWRSF